LAIGTVHRFQGGERSIILLSTAVTQTSSLRFVDQRVNLVNVAASRARDHLITIGHEPTLSAGRFTRALLGDARRLERLS
jgi:superfamily I DNA and/or RNA helicase